MTTVTLQLPDELAARLEPMRDRLPRLLAIALESYPELSAAVPSILPTHPIFVQVMDFIASAPTREQIITYKVSPEAQERLEELLDKNREEGLSPAESAELDMYELINHIMILLKARARRATDIPRER
ncbi:MAG: hypothetical protein HY327_05635 [Chloroflexi bacterium]|nr:hypothetical protein [Chloroflexota bacterium]